METTLKFVTLQWQSILRGHVASQKEKNFQHPLINPLTLTPTLQTIPMQLQQLY